MDLLLKKALWGIFKPVFVQFGYFDLFLERFLVSRGTLSCVPCFHPDRVLVDLKHLKDIIVLVNQFKLDQMLPSLEVVNLENCHLFWYSNGVLVYYLVAVGFKLPKLGGRLSYLQDCVAEVS